MMETDPTDGTSSMRTRAPRMALGRLACRVALAWCWPGARVRWLIDHPGIGHVYCQVILPSPHPIFEGCGPTPVAAFRHAIARAVTR